MLSVLAAYASEHGAEALERSAGALRARIAGAFAAAPKRPGREADLERYLGEGHFAELVGWVVGRERRGEAAAAEGAILAAALTGRAR
jgi:AcrR family transcriptional regulator